MLAGMLAGPLYGEGQPDWAALANAPTDKLSMAVYEAVQANPDSAADILKEVAARSSAWNTTRAYAVVRAVLLAYPSLETKFIQSSMAYLNGAPASSAGDALSAALVDALVAADVNVATVVMYGVAGSAVQGIAAGNGLSAVMIDRYIPDLPGVPAPQYPVTPTPPPASPNN